MTSTAPVRATPVAATTHPLAWWAWGIGCAVAASRIGNPAVLVLLLLAVVLVGLGARTASPWARTLEAALILGAVVILVRCVFYLLVGLPDSSPVLLHLPEIALPDWVNNLVLLGPVHQAGLVQAAIGGLSLAVLIVIFGAVNAVANPRIALRSLPSSLHHLGTAAVIAVAATPQLFTAAARVRRAQRLRGTPPRGLRGLAAVVIPVLAGALDQALDLAASMDSRGYARAHRGGRRLVGAALVVALLAAVAGSYALLDPTSPPALSAGLLAGGLVLAVGASVLAARSVRRTRYRPQRWQRRETAVAGCGLLVAAIGWFTVGADPAGMGAWRAGAPWPGVPAVALLLVLLAAAPVLLAPPRKESR
ncbi:CbiQ family ECF transporter T component [Ruania zhangjianzhongii]|uniref:CbiQ family ECF transporter T component n=1 Tax=Ruania zhangjianzhongii TaxID=2603206 RepID=UPI0011CB43D3|nr:CbiQ family ECF transporter T component [Ruania zhangjianzhongii]